MKSGKLLFFLTFLLINASVFGQFKIQGVIRPRFEYRNGYGTFRNDTTVAAAFVSQRTRLNFSYKTEKIETKLSIFDYRVWGDQVWKKDLASMGLNEAWAKIKINDFWSVKFGRQALNYDNNRLISPVNWNQIGASHDALKADYINKGWTIDLVSAWNQSSQNKFGTDYYWSDSFYKSLNIFWISKEFKKFSIASFNISDGFQDLSNPEKQHFRFTYGLIPEFKNDKFRVTGRLLGQSGKLQSGQNIKAFYTNLDFLYKVSDKINIIAGNEIKSGNNGLDSLNTTNHAFDILYGAKHKFNGRIDYFSLPATTNGAGFIDSYLKADLRFVKSSSISAEYHYFMLENNYLYNGKVIDKFLGNEIDFVYKQDFANDIALEAGYSFILGTKSAEIIKTGNINLWNHWFYLMVTIDPTLFTVKNN